MTGEPRLKIAVIGTGISGMSAAWLLNLGHEVTVYERAGRPGGHSNTVDASGIPVDTGFIVYNPLNYPNLAALFDHLGVPTKPSDMSFGVSLDAGDLEYSGSDLAGLFAQKRNLLRPRFLSMLRDLTRFYRDAPAAAAALADPAITLGDYLRQGGYGEAFCRDHLLPMAAAIWSAPPQQMLDYPAAAFIRFHANHGLLQIADRPEWRTVDGGSKVYVKKLTAGFADRIRLDCGAVSVRRSTGGVLVRDGKGRVERFDHVVLASHADQSLGLLEDADETERRLLGAFRYSHNLAVLHTDARFMPKRRAAWSSWNFIGDRSSDAGVCVTYWMNRLQSLAAAPDMFVTLNPPEPPHAGTLLHSEVYEHPMFDTAAIRAQSELWSLQGRGNTWFCGAYFGAGFHEDGLQAGLAVAEALGGVRRPWRVANESGRIHLPSRCAPNAAEMA
ncbi:MAG: FAD-dependent oxidoreductase [Proteobacteria bacterium]|nr:FAD-dependent oxidoreductase [Pseudomonadota bacterium]